VLKELNYTQINIIMSVEEIVNLLKEYCSEEREVQHLMFVDEFTETEWIYDEIDLFNVAKIISKKINIKE
jgi:hypothetical protein